MGKISELDTAIRDLRTAAATINDVADTLAEMFSEDEPATPSETVTETAQSLTFDQVSNTFTAIARLSKAHSQKLRALVQQYGATKLSEIASEHYEAILAEAEVIRNAG